MHSPVLVSYPRHIHSPEFMRPSSLLMQSGPVHQPPTPKMHLSPLMSPVPVAPSENNGCMHSALATKGQSRALTTTAVKHQSPHTMLIQPIEYMSPAVQSFTPPTPIFTVTQSPTIFPSEDIKKTQTTASYSKEPIPELVNSDQGEWTFSLDVPIPKTMVYPTLTSLDYTIKYGTENGSGTSTIQASVVLTKTRDAILDSIPNRITTNPPSVCINGVGVGIPPQMLGGEPIVCLSSVPAVKDNGHTSQLEHYIDRQQLLPNVRITEDSRLYLQLQVTEAPSPLMLRSLVVDVSTAWAEDMQAKAMLDKIAAAELRRKVAEQKKADEEHARLQAERKSAEAKQAKDIAERKEKAAKKKSEDAQEAKKQADQQADADRLAKKQADDLAETHRRAKEAADAVAHSLRKAKHDADRRASAEHKAEVEAETRAEKEREARSAIERQLSK